MRLRQLPVGATPRLQLAHRTATGGPYDLYPITEPRPAVGTVDTTVVCGTCGEPVSLRLSSAEWVRDRRRSRLLTTVSILLTVVGLGAFLIVQDLRLDWGGGPFVIGAILIIFVFIGTGGDITDSREEDGVTTPDLSHSLREPGSRHDYADHDGGNYEAGL